MYGGCDYESYNRAVMINSCHDGMYFESVTPSRPQTNIFIKIYVDLPKSFASEQYKAFRARVKWCRQFTAGEKHFYGTGVQYLVKSHLLYGANILNADNLCDYCDQQITDRLIHRTESGLILCNSCLQHIETLPGNMVNAVERVLMGNVA